MMRATILLGALALTAPAAAQFPEDRPAPGEEIVFDVYRGGSTEFGTHTVSFSEDGGDLMVAVEIRLKAGLGPVTVFRYEHDSTERWRDSELVGFTGRTLKDGETYEVSATAENGSLSIQGEGPEAGAFTRSYERGILPSSHWHGYPEGMVTLLNTEFGTDLSGEVVYMGKAEIEADGGTIEADHYRLNSDLALDLYYDADGDWAGCRFEARGREIRYVRRSAPAGS